MTDSRREMTEEEMLEVIRQCRPEDFDGHIDWHALIFEQQLQWICTSARIWQEWGGIARKGGKPDLVKEFGENYRAEPKAPES